VLHGRTGGLPALSQACVDNDIWGCFQSWQREPGGYPIYTPVHRPQGEVQLLNYRRCILGYGRTVGAGDGGHSASAPAPRCQIGLIHLPRRDDFPEWSGKRTYKGAEIMIRTPG